MNQSKLNGEIEFFSRQLKLPAFRNEVEAIDKQALEKKYSFKKSLRNLLEIEYQQRLVRRKTQRIKRAGFPYIKELSDLDEKQLPKDAKEKLSELQSLQFIDQGRNIILAGNPGTGKTHIAIGLAIKACKADYTVYFTTVHKLITQINEARSERTLRSLQNKFEKYDLVICDEFGYISYDKNAAELLFTHLSIRASRKSTIITTNLGFDKWSEIFKDKILTAAMVDRLTHRAIFLNMIGNSYRIIETNKLNNKK